MTNIYITGNTSSDGCCIWQIIKGCITAIIAVFALAACCGASALPLL